MKKPNLIIDNNDLKVLFIHTTNAYKGLSFESWKIECLNSYMIYYNRVANAKTYSQWVNGQIIALT
jgi:hypothetical protein